MTSSQSSRYTRSAERSSAPVVLSVGRNTGLPVFCSSSLRDAGYTLQLAFTADEALRKIHEVGVDIVVFGEGIDSGERTRMEGALQSLRPRPRIIMLYDISIARAEQADAVLNIKGDPQDLVRTIRYLLTGTC